MIVVQEWARARKAVKPVICPKCKRGKIGKIPMNSKAVMSRRGRPPPEEEPDGVYAVCTVCDSLWILTTE